MASRGRPRYPDILTPREWEVLELLRGAFSNAQIAERLGITERTAKFHVSEILSKLGVETREDAAAWQPEERKRWWTGLPSPLKWGAIAKIAEATVLVASAAGLAVLAWGILRTEGTTDKLVENFEPTPIQTHVNSTAYDRRLELDLEIDRPLYTPSEPVQLKLTVRNISDRPLRLYFLDEQRYDFSMICERNSYETDLDDCLDMPPDRQDEGRLFPGSGRLSKVGVWFWSRDASFAENRGKVTLAVGESLTYTETWNQTANYPENTVSLVPAVDWPLPRTAEFHTRYMGSASFLGCIARTTTIAEEPFLEELACDRPYVGSVVFELVP